MYLLSVQLHEVQVIYTSKIHIALKNDFFVVIGILVIDGEIMIVVTVLYVSRYWCIFAEEKPDK